VRCLEKELENKKLELNKLIDYGFKKIIINIFILKDYLMIIS